MTDKIKANNEKLSFFQKAKKECLEHPRAFLNAAIVTAGLAAGLFGYNKELYSNIAKPVKAIGAVVAGAGAYYVQRQRDNLNVQRRLFQPKENETPEQRDSDKMLTITYLGTVITSALPVIAPVHPLIGILPGAMVIADNLMDYALRWDNRARRKELQNKRKNKKAPGPER